MKINYEIYSGAGNDFIMVNNCDVAVPFGKQIEWTENICKDYPNIDGVIFVDKPSSNEAKIRMNYYNRDGSYGAMCGNGARCTAQFAVDHKIISDLTFNIEAVDKLYRADILGNNIVRIHFPDVTDYKLNQSIQTNDELKINKLHWMQVGSEHIVVYIDDIINPEINSLDNIPINEWGSYLRYHEQYRPKGGNVNFAEVLSKNEIRIRTYERGVERETLACGTGIVSSAIISCLLNKTTPPVKVKVQSGELLEVGLTIKGNAAENVTLTGSARKISS